jgi:hypothetical protein
MNGKLRQWLKGLLYWAKADFDDCMTIAKVLVLERLWQCIQSLCHCEVGLGYFR